MTASGATDFATNAERARLNVLFLAKQFPWPLNVGSRQRVFHLLRGIASAHDVTTIAFDASPETCDLDALASASGSERATVVAVPRSNGETVPHGALSRHLSRATRAGRTIAALATSPLPAFVRDVWSEELVRAIVSAARTRPFDLVYATRSWMGEHARAAGLSPIIVDVDDLMSVMTRQVLAQSPWSLRKAVNAVEAAKELRYERSLPKRFSRLVVAKPEDREFFDASHRDRIDVVPNGISIPAAPLPEPAIANRLLFVGTLGYGPNIDAVRWFATEILPRVWRERPDVHLDVAGYGSGASLMDVLADPRCTVHESPPDLTPLYAGAAVVIAPVRIGGGTRIKILEALARGRALVSTVFAAEGLDLRGGVDLEFADSPADMAARCVELLADPARRASLGAAGRRSVAERFDWRHIERTLSAMMPQLVQTASRSR